MKRPKPALNIYNLEAGVYLENSVTEYWLCNNGGCSYYLKWLGSGWVIQTQNSFLCKDNTFQHKDDIPSFKYSGYGDVEQDEKEGKDTWKHIFTSK